jgi:5'-phosphate synthase pdxT subunit
LKKREGGKAKLKIGILAVQGDFAAHAAMLQQFLQEEGLAEAIRRFAADRRPVFGTCAGAILLATQVKNPEQASLGLLDMTILRNGYGRQLASDVFYEPSSLKNEPLEMVFIRGPVIEKVAKGIDVLAKH